MSPFTVGIIGILSVLILMACRMPIGLAMMLVGFVGFGLIIRFSAAFHVLQILPFDLISKYDYCVLPLFLLMASVCLATGLGKSLYDVAYHWLGHLPGGLAIATIGACALFSAISASSIATAVTMGVIAIPEMKKHRYHQSLATGCCAAGGSLGILIPPSGILIIYGIMTEQPIQKLFAASIIPGVLLAFLFMTIIYIHVRLNPKIAPKSYKMNIKQRLEATRNSVDMIVLILLVIGGLIIGWFTPSEAGAMGAFGAIVISLVRKRLNVANMKSAILETLNNTGMIFLILIGAFVLNEFLAVSNIPMELARMVSGFNLPRVVIMGFIIIVYLFLGCLLDAMAMILLTLPIFMPLVIELGYDPIWFGVVLVLIVEMGMITPPIGMNVYVINGIARDVPMQAIFKGVLPFFIAEILFVLLLIAFPQIVLFIPQHM